MKLRNLACLDLVDWKAMKLQLVDSQPVDLDPVELKWMELQPVDSKLAGL